MAEPISFRVGKVPNNDEAVWIAAGTVQSSLSAAELAAKNRGWQITASGTDGAFLPANYYRRMVVVDNSRSTARAVVYLGSDVTSKVADGAHDFEVAAGQQWEMPKPIQTGPMSVQLVGASATPCLVSETSFN